MNTKPWPENVEGRDDLENLRMTLPWRGPRLDRDQFMPHANMAVNFRNW
jgi:hypothetical protein